MRSSVLATVESHRCFGGTQSVYLHNSESTRSPMRVGVFQPEGEGPFPVLYFLSGLTCTEQNFITKAAVQRYAAEVGMMIVAPDTSPREVDTTTSAPAPASTSTRPSRPGHRTTGCTAT
jgi:S-formylglutathione hydrolase